MIKKKLSNLTGQKFGRLLVVGYSHKEGNYHYYNCLCDCTDGLRERPIIKVKGKQLKDGSTKSCGCLRAEHAKEMPKNNKQRISKELIKHMPYYSILYTKWYSYWQMCYNPNVKNYQSVGAKGVKMYSLWADKEIGIIFFYAWAIQQGFEEGDRVERLNKKLDYSPENCKILKCTTKKKTNRTVNHRIKEKKLNKAQSAEQIDTMPVNLIKNDILLLASDISESKLANILNSFGIISSEIVTEGSIKNIHIVDVKDKEKPYESKTIFSKLKKIIGL